MTIGGMVAADVHGKNHHVEGCFGAHMRSLLLRVAEGGRIYFAKDAFTRPEHFRAMEPRLDRWLAVRRRWDPELKIRSAQSVRLFGDPS